MDELPKILALKPMHMSENTALHRKLETLTQLLGDAVYDTIIYHDKEGDFGKEYQRKLLTQITEANAAFMANLTMPSQPINK